MNVYTLFENARRAFGDRAAVRFGARRQSYAELGVASASFAAHLASLGLRPGDRVAIFMPNHAFYPIALLGAFHGGFVAVPINAKLHPREAAYIIANAEAKAVVIDAERRDEVRQGLAQSPQMLTVDAQGLNVPPALGSGMVDRAPDDPAWLFYTSGTTGRPKGAVLSHRNLIAMAVNCLADICDFRPDDRLLHAAPLSHGSGLYLLPALARGSENIIDDGASFEPSRILRFIADQRVTVLPFLAPTMIVRLLDGDPAIETPKLRAMIYGGAPIHLEHVRAALRRFGPVLTQLYGQGEAPMTISALPAWAHDGADDETLRSAGFVRAGVDVRLLDQTDGVGEIAVGGDVVMRGYWRNESANATAFEDGYLRTGDIGRFDDRGRLHILDRRHDTIISGGSNIYPREVEDVLTEHPGVKEAIVFGLPDTQWGEIVAAAVVLRDELVDADALIAFCRERLASFKKPKRIEVLAEFPKNAYGKVLRRELRTRFLG